MISAHRLSLLLLCLLAGCNASSKSVPATPDGATSAIMTGLSDDKPEVIWNALPDRYQKDVKGLISDFGNQMDNDVWDKTFIVLNKVVRVAKEKRNFILGSPILADGAMAEKKEEMSNNWDSVIGLVQTLTDSEIKTLAGVKKLDPEAFLSDTVAKFSRYIKKLAAVDPSDKLRASIDQLKAKVTVVKADGDSATIRIEASGEPPHERRMKKVDGKWLPAELVDGWDQGISQAKQKIGELKITAEQKAGILDAIGAADKALDQLLLANSQEEFNEAAGGVVGMLMAFAPQGAGPGPDFNALQGPDEPIESRIESFEVTAPDDDADDMPSDDDADLKFRPAPDPDDMPQDSDESTDESEDAGDETTEA